MRAGPRLLALLLCAGGALPGIAPSPAAADPQLVFSTYLGGAFKYGDIGNDVAVDAAGNVYVTGRSYYSSFPVTPGAFQTHFKPIGPWDTTAFVAKFDPTGSRLTYATYLSGKGGETTGEGIAVDAAGDAYVSGYTSSDGFPTTPGTLRESGTGGFVAKLDPSGGGLLYATLIGDSSTHAGRIAVDPSGGAYVAGAGSVVKLNPTGSALDYTHRLDPGGVAGLTADSEGHAYLAQTKGTSASLTELAADGSGVVASTPLGGPPLGPRCRCGISGVAVDSEGHAFVTGGAGSPKFQTTTGALRWRRVGRPRTSVPFLSELGPAGGAPIYSTYLSAAGDFASAVAVGPGRPRVRHRRDDLRPPAGQPRGVPAQEQRSGRLRRLRHRAEPIGRSGSRPRRQPDRTARKPGPAARLARPAGHRRADGKRAQRPHQPAPPPAAPPRSARRNRLPGGSKELANRNPLRRIGTMGRRRRLPRGAPQRQAPAPLVWTLHDSLRLSMPLQSDTPG